MPDTFFTEPPHWRWLIALYFFIGGIAGGCFFLAALLHMFGRPGDRAIVRIGYYVAMIGVAISGILLIVDLGRPDRFWHMMIQNKTGRPMFKYWAPMSVGVWGLLIFGVATFLATLGALYEDGKVPWRLASAFMRGPWSIVIDVIGGLGGFFLAGYTGVLLSVTNRPVWADSSWLGVLYLLSAASSAAAVLILVARRRRLSDGTSVRELERFDKYILALELIVLIVFVISLGSAGRAFLNAWGAVLVLVVLGGILAPMLIGFGRVTHFRGRPLTAATAAALVLLGGFMLRITTIFPSEQVRVVGTRVTRP